MINPHRPQYLKENDLSNGPVIMKRLGILFTEVTTLFVPKLVQLIIHFFKCIWGLAIYYLNKAQLTFECVKLMNRACNNYKIN